MRPWFRSEALMRVVAPLLVGIVVVALWELACRAAQVPIFLFPKPSDIAATVALFSMGAAYFMIYYTGYGAISPK